MKTVLQVRELSKLYQNKRGIRNISFEVMQGDIYGLLGPNGAGKTTLMKTITGLCRADQGEVNILGFKMPEQFEQAMAKVGCIIETADAYDYLSGYKNLELASRFYPALKKTRIDEVLEIVDLSEFKSERVENYSLGMKQRLALASALLAYPELIVLDEPTNGLDIEGMVEIRNLILNLAREHRITFFISSHLAHEMELMCNRIGIIYQGNLIKEGTVVEILAAFPSLEDYFIQQTRTGKGEFKNE
jgi:ABC-type multidrug transport system, ATPase component